MKKNANIFQRASGVIEEIKRGGDYRKDVRLFDKIKRRIVYSISFFDFSAEHIEHKNLIKKVEDRIKRLEFHQYLESLAQNIDPIKDAFEELAKLPVEPISGRDEFFEDAKQYVGAARHLAMQSVEEQEQSEVTRAPPPPKTEPEAEPKKDIRPYWMRSFQEKAEKKVRDWTSKKKQKTKPEKPKKEFIRFYAIDRKGNYRFFKIQKDRAKNVISFGRRKGWFAGFERDLPQTEPIWANPNTIMRYEVSGDEWER